MIRLLERHPVLLAALGVLALVFMLPLQAAEQQYSRGTVRYYGSASANDALLFTTGDVTYVREGCMLMSVTGAVDVEGSLDGTNFSTTVIALQDLGATTLDPVQLTAAGRMYFVPGKYVLLRVRQNGATAASASMLCW